MISSDHNTHASVPKAYETCPRVNKKTASLDSKHTEVSDDIGLLQTLRIHAYVKDLAQPPIPALVSGTDDDVCGMLSQPRNGIGESTTAVNLSGPCSCR